MSAYLDEIKKIESTVNGKEEWKAINPEYAKAHFNLGGIYFEMENLNLIAKKNQNGDHYFLD